MRKTAQPSLWDGKYFLLAFAFFTFFTLIFIPQHVLSYLLAVRL